MTDLFTPGTTNAEPNPQALFEELVGEGKKYKDAAALAKSKVVGDQHISTLEAENAKLRDELQKRRTTEELLAKIKEEGLLAVNRGIPEPTTAPVITPASSDTIKKEDIYQIAQQIIEQDRTKTSVQANVDTVRNGLIAAYGPNYHDQLNARAVTVGLTKEQLSALAEINPKAFLNIIVGEPSRDNPNAYSPPRTTQVRSPVSDPDVQKWQQAKKDRSYRNPQVQIELNKKSLEAGRSILG